MKVITKDIFIILLFTIFSNSYAQELAITKNSANGKLHYWEASWVTHPSASVYNYGVYHLRNNYILDDVPNEFSVYVSGDNRYKLFVNGQLVCFGPARGMVRFWRYEALDIAPYLKEGENIIAVELVNFGKHVSHSLQSVQTAFIFQAGKQKYNELNTGSGNWKIIKNEAYKPIPYAHEPGGLYAVGPGDEVDATKYPHGWKKVGFIDEHWKKAKKLAPGHGRGIMYGNSWCLVERNIPLLEQKKERIQEVVAGEGMKELDLFIQGNNPFTIPPRKNISILLDQAYLTIGFPELFVSKGGGSRIEIKYAEALYQHQPGQKGRNEYIKGNRNETEGKLFIGNKDIFLPDGGDNKTFSPLFFRTYRYIQLNIQTSDEPLVLNDFYNLFTAYPYTLDARFETGEPKLDQILEIGWRTQRLCAGETYFDCPYYEQMNYSGDTRVQALVCYAMSGDDRLTKDAISLFNQSRLPNTLTQARAPSNEPLIINGYSLYYISMIYDYLMYRDDDKWLKQFLPGIKYNLEYFQRHIDSGKNLLKALPWWNYTDWANEWFGGIPDGADDGYSSITNLHFIYTLQHAVEIFNHFGKTHEAEKWKKLENVLKERVKDVFYSEEKNLFADIPEKDIFSQHANILAILTNTCPGGKERQMMETVLNDKTLVQSTYYYKYYLFSALKEAGLANQFLNMLGPWEEMMDNGLTTFAERPEPTRSDCHAWSSNPLYFFMDIVCGVRPLEPGFKSLQIKPELGYLDKIEAEFPHPEGIIIIKLKKIKNIGINGNISIPGNTEAVFIWQDQKIRLQGGDNKISL